MQPIFNYLASRFHSNFSFFLVKNKFFINHKKKEKDDIIFFHVKKNKIKTTNYRFFKLFFRYRKKLYYNYKVIFFIKYVLLPDKDYITTFLNLTFKRFSKNIKNKIIKNDKLNFNFHFSLANIKKYFLKKN